MRRNAAVTGLHKHHDGLIRATEIRYVARGVVIVCEDESVSSSSNVGRIITPV